MTKRKLPATPGARRRFQLKYPRAVDLHDGFTQVDDLFDGTTILPAVSQETSRKRK